MTSRYRRQTQTAVPGNGRAWAVPARAISTQTVGDDDATCRRNVHNAPMRSIGRMTSESTDIRKMTLEEGSQNSR